MKRKLHFAIWTLFLILGYSAAINAQTKDPSISSQDKLPPLECEAPIDPAWLQQAKERGIASKDFDEPIVRVAYLIPSNRSAQPKGVEALQLVIRTGRDFFKAQMAFNGLVPKTFRYETEADGETPLIHVVNIPETDAEIEEANQGNHFSNKVNAAINAGLTIWQQGEIWILVSETHRQQPNSSIMVGGALGSSTGDAGGPGVATMSSTFLTPLGQEGLTDDRAYHGLIIPEIGPYPLQQSIFSPGFNGSTISSLASVTLGAFLHELMHAFGINPHDFRNDDNFHGNLMGNGFRGIRGTLYPDRYPNDYTRLAFVSAHVLNTNHYFNTGKMRNQIDELDRLSVRPVPRDGKLRFNVSVTDADGLSLLRLIGSPDYTGIEQVLNGNHFSAEIRTPYFEPGTPSTYRLQVYDMQGNKAERVIQTTPLPGNRAPWPSMQFKPPTGDSGDTFLLDAGRSRDPDNDKNITYEWDFFYDHIFDTTPTSDPRSNLSIQGGNHLMRVRVTDPSGAQTFSTPMALHVSGEPSVPAKVSFTLIDAATNKVIPDFDPIPDNAFLDPFVLPSQLSIRANVAPEFESIRFDLNGKKDFRVENLEPYALFGDLQGDYNAGELALGTHVLSATPFLFDDAGGALNMTSTLRFTVQKTSGAFIWVDADTDEDLFDMNFPGGGLDFNAIKNQKLNIRTSHNIPREGLSVHFQITGPINRTWTEHVFPYALFGDVDGDFDGMLFPAGRYHIKAIYDYGDEVLNQDGTIDFTSPNIERTFDIKEGEISHFTVHVDPFLTEGTEIFQDGRIFHPDVLPFSLNSTIFAIPTTTPVGSIMIGISGPITFSRIENVRPYSLFGDTGDDFGSRLFPEGDYELTATPYTEPNGQGIAGKTLTITFSIGLDDAYNLNGAGLYDAESLDFLDELLSTDDGNTTLRSLVNNATVILDYDCINAPCPGSIFMALNGPVTSSRIENEEPFSLFGDQNGNFIGQTLPVGDYTLTFTSYSQDNALGTEGRTTTADFSIVDSFFQKTSKALLYPNPARSIAKLQTDGTPAISGTAMIFDFLGREVKRIPHFDPGLLQHIDVSDLAKGIYFVKIQVGSERITKKLIVQ